MFIQHLKVSGLLSFGPTGLDLPMEPLNVLIGPNGSGKSNLLEVLALLRAAPTALSAPVKAAGGIGEWLWKGDGARNEAALEASLVGHRGSGEVVHRFAFSDHGRWFEMERESIASGSAGGSTTEDQSRKIHYTTERSPVLIDANDRVRTIDRASLNREESILSQVRDPELYPVLTWLQEQYRQIQLYRNWRFGPSAPWRQDQSAQARSDLLNDGGENLIPVVVNLLSRVKPELIDALRKLFDGIEDLGFSLGGGNVQLFLIERGREIPASRLSDGTLRYLALLAILLHPDPPPLVAIEEPELGLHPDVIPALAELLVRASARTQLVVTTHSRMLVDALSDQPSSVVVCEQENGESHFRRLDGQELRAWLDDYSLGTLWSMGELGGNRW